MINSIFNWIVLSSKDPNKVSLTVRAALLSAIPGAIWAVGTLCATGGVCIPIADDELRTVANAAADLAFLALSAVSAIGIIYGFLRKIWLTVTGKNAVINQ